MTVNYNKLWKMLIDKNMYKKDLAAELALVNKFWTRISKNYSVTS